MHGYTINYYCYRHDYFTVYGFVNSINHLQEQQGSISCLFQMNTISLLLH